MITVYRYDRSKRPRQVPSCCPNPVNAVGMASKARLLDSDVLELQMF